MELIKKNALIVGVVVVILVCLGGYFIWSRSQGGVLIPREEQQNIKQMSPEDIGLELSLRSDQKAVIIRATKLEGIESLEYELTYDAEAVDEGETHAVPRGAVGELTIRGDTASAEVDLGTCSANVCKYDKVISDIKVVIKVNFENGEIGAVEDTIPLEE